MLLEEFVLGLAYQLSEVDVLARRQGNYSHFCSNLYVWQELEADRRAVRSVGIVAAGGNLRKVRYSE